MKKRRIRWDRQVVAHFNKVITYIRQESPLNADMVKQEIITRVNELSERPEIHPPDKYKEGNTGNYRAFEMHHFRISYLVTDEEVIIARIRHTSQQPKKY